MRWTKGAEDTLWQTVFKTQSFHIDLVEVSREWPGEEKPTPKALKEHLAKYRKNIGAEGRITFGMTAKKCAESSSATPVGTPRKRAAKKAGDGVQKDTPKKGAKGKQSAIGAQDGNVEEDAAGADIGEGYVKEEEQDEDEDLEMCSSKKVKVEDDKDDDVF